MNTASVVEIPESHEVRDVSQRFLNAYEQADATTDFGEFVKVAAIVAGVATFLGTLAFSDRSAVLTMGGTAAAVFVGVMLYLAGMVLCSQGQLLRTMIDAAVNSSPFLTNATKARMLLLHKDSEVTPISGELKSKAQSR